MKQFLAGMWLAISAGLLVWFFWALPSHAEDAVHAAAYITATVLLEASAFCAVVLAVSHD